MDFEKKLSRLEEIVTKIEGGNLSLEESLKLFEEGVKNSRECQKHLTEAEEKVKVLLKISDDGSAVTKDFTE
ncbi:MAG: exodeoxyribonuclease VII small subunit [Bdellovibrionales bacterium RBG_16_40_8]|nr:MAG: exodeoxyribonuclease VII small subunit [Bdellovibrionales bacterium RBG_16_40_8]